MNKIKEPYLFKSIKVLLTVYLPTIRSKSTNTIAAYRDMLTLFISFLKDTRALKLKEITKEHFNCDNVLSFLEWLVTMFVLIQKYPH